MCPFLYFGCGSYSELPPSFQRSVVTMYNKAYSGIALFFIALVAPNIILSQGVWTRDIATGFNARYHAASGIVDDKIYLIGGDESTAQIQCFDPVKELWSSPVFVGDDSSYSEMAYCTAGNKIYLIGGYHKNQTNTEIVIVDPRAKTLMTLPTIGHYTPRDNSTCAEVNGRIYLFGGSSGGFGAPAVDTIEVFDLASNTWSGIKTTGQYTPLIGMSSNVIDGKIYLIGGQDAVSLLSTVQIFDPTTSTFIDHIVSDIFTGRGFHTSGVIGGKIYVVGGGGSAFPIEWLNHPDTTEQQIFDPATKTWTTSHYSGEFTSRIGLNGEVYNGLFYTFGGYRPHHSTNDVEVLTPGAINTVSSEQKSTSLSITPNPATSSVTVRNVSGHIKIFDFLGRIIYNNANSFFNNEIAINIRNYPSGVYLIRNDASTIRFVKE